jgi:cytidine deaminase
VRETDEALFARAQGAQMRSYSPYSKFRVGAAVEVGASGNVYEGANVENASYGLAVCAERNAVMRAVLDGAREIAAVAVASDITPPAPPCGMCLQTLMEFASDPKKVRVILGNGRGERIVHTLHELLPHGFRPDDLTREREKA